MKKSLSNKESFWHGKDSLTSKTSIESQTIHWTPELFGPVFETEKISLHQSYRAHQEEKKTKMISTFVPDEIIYKTDFTKKSFDEFSAIILFIEISDFHDIWDKFSPTENSASYGLNFLLSKYLGPIIENVYNYDGDVIKLDADGILGVWKVQPFQSTAEIVETVIKCGLKSQERVKYISTTLKVKIKMTISTGNLEFSIIGNDNYRKWLLVGQPIIEAESAANICNPGEVILTKSTWQYVRPTNYEYVPVDSHSIRIIKEIGLPRLERKTSNLERLSNNPNESKVEEISIMRTSSDKKKPTSNPYRSSIKDAVALNIGNKLSKFLIPFLTFEIENNRALELLTQIQNVSILSINITPVKSSTQKIVNLCDKCFHYLFKLTEKYFGIIKTVKVYPKRIYFSVYFGFLRDKSFSYENSLMCAEKYRVILRNIEDIVKLSIGISTGMVFCGVIGHKIRQSFICTGLSCEKSEKIATVASQYVNCDFDTVLCSDLPRNRFRLRSVKGITGFGKFNIYEFHDLNEKQSWASRKIDKIYPIIGCFDQLEKLTDIFDDICASSRTYCGVFIEGSDSVGKSRLLDECVLIAKSRQISICTVSLNFLNTTRAYNTIYQILLEILQIHDCYSVEQRKKDLISKIGNLFPSNKFCYLNVLLNVNFTHSSIFLSENEEQRVSKTLVLFDKLLESIEKPTGIFIDDIHFMDLESWAFVSRIMNCKNFILAMTVDNSKSSSSNQYNDSRLFKFTLNGFNLEEMRTLVCHLLNVHAISQKIDRILNNGNWINAGWIEAFISLMLERKWFEFYFHDEKVNFQDLISPPLVTVIKVPYGVFPEEINPHLPQDKFLVLDIKSTSSNGQFMNDETYLDIDIFYKKLFHRLTSYEQSVLRSAAVLGDIFTRETLENVTPNSMDFHTARAITRLMDLRILECASIQRFNYNLSPYVKRNTFSDMHHLLHCSCYQTNVPVRDEQLPSYAGCKLLEFKVKAFRRFVYDQMLPSQKRELHSRAAEIYERQAKTCISCGGGSFLNTLGVVQGIGTDARALRPSIVRRSLSRDGIYFSKFEFRKRNSSTDSPDQEGIHHQKISILPTFLETKDESQHSTDDLSLASDKENFTKSELFLLKKSDPSKRSQLKKFNLIDFRNCDCENVLNGVFQELLWHLQHTDSSDKLVEYMVEYSAGLIFICRYWEAFSILIITKEINDKLPFEKRWKNKYIIWGLMGDASLALGNISKAKKYFKEAIRLLTNDQHFDMICVKPKAVCRVWHRKVNKKLINRFYRNRFTENEMSKRLVIAYHLMKLSKVLLIQGESIQAEFIAINAINTGFSSLEGFTQKCELYVKACEIFRGCRQLKTARKLDKQILIVIMKKFWWAYVDEIVCVLRVFKTMFEVRLLLREYRDALEIGSKLLKISKSLHAVAIQLEILPLLISLTIRMKRIYETADLMQELYHLSNQDIDKSSITWYYALALDLTLDAGMVLESFEHCAEHAKEILVANKNRSYVLRDPESLKRLLTCLWIWQLRSGTTVTATFAQCCASYATNVKPDNYAQLLNLLKTFEAYFLMLKRCIDIKRSDELSELLQNTNLILKTLERQLSNASFIKPRFYMLKAYFKLAHGDKHSAKSLLKKARKYASSQGNEMLLAWILLNEKMWKKLQFNSTSNFWMENVRCVDSFNWRDIHDFDVKVWSSILFLISPPDSCL